MRHRRRVRASTEEVRVLRRSNTRMDDIEDTTVYKVVVNEEEQYSIWPDDRPNPAGWHDAGRTGPKAECLAYVKETWTDMRPLSLRRRMAMATATPGSAPS
jgi:MbtH protein